MTLLLDPARLAGRRAIAAGALAPLARSLADDLHAAIARVVRDGVPYVPAEKARMTRRGGRCRRDGALLAFDPFEPRTHRCPACGAAYDDEADHRWWIMWYQLWLAERAAHAAVLRLLTGDAALGAFAARVLDAYAERYLAYPNRDNVLGPTRPFFSTYLESIWLLQLCVALDALEAADPAGARALGGRVRDRVVEPSRALIAGYDEGASNRQVWNGAALLAASRLLGEPATFERAVEGPSGLASQLRESLLADGTWYEGENYHQFAHRGLWYAVTLAERAGAALDPGLAARFEAGFVAPFLTALPDLTLPARRDSQYAISLRQWRYAESCELGLARRDDGRLAGALARLYDASGVERRDTGRWRSAAESERNEPPTALSRADLGWRSLLHARAELPAGAAWSPRSVLLPAQGLAILRRDGGSLYAALDYGHSGGGHGHPDRLNVLLADGVRRWLDDMGTGSYVERALHWYRSTLAHNAPLADGRSQQRVDGYLLAFDDGGSDGWAHAGAGIAPGVVARRALVVARDYVVDRLAWTADREVVLDLPVHLDVDLRGAGPWRPVEPGGAGGLEDGFDFLRDVEGADVAAGTVVELVVEGRTVARAWMDRAGTWLRAAAPGAPGQGTRRFVLARSTGGAGRITVVLDPRGVVARAGPRGDAIVVTRADGGTDAHEERDGTWRIARRDASGRASTTSLGGEVPPPSGAAPIGATPTSAAPPPEPLLRLTLARDGTPLDLALGEAHYRRSEPTWTEAGRPTARVRLAAADDRLVVHVDVRKDAPTFVPAGAENELDNERPEVNGDGVQLHARPGGGADRRDALAWLLVPEPSGGGVRAIATTPAASAVGLRAAWRRTGDGYAVSCELPLAAVAPDGGPFLLDVVVNETAPGRERRRGQLVLSGSRGGFVYLQGDRYEPRVLVTIR